MLPQVNAQITRVERIEGTASTGFTEDYDRPQTDTDAGEGGQDLWSGNADAYYIEKRQRIVSAAGRDLVKSRSLIVRPPIEFAEGDTLTWIFNGAENSGKVLVVEVHRMPGIEPIVRLTLEDV